MSGGRVVLALATAALVTPLPAQEFTEPPPALRAYTLLYTTRVDGDPELFLRRLADGHTTRVTDSRGADLGGQVSPDAGRVAFHSRRDGQFEVYLATLPGGDDPRNLTDDPAEDLLPSWSPDGGSLIIFSTRGEPRGADGAFRGHLYRLTLTGGAPERLTPEVLTSTFGGTLSPDGRRLLYANAIDGEIWMLERDVASEAQPRRLAPGYGGRYSPDGRQIAFHHSGPGTESRLAVLDASTGAVRELTSGHQDYEPGWSPDGAWLVFSRLGPDGRTAGIHAIAATGGAVTPLVTGAVDARSGSLFTVR